MKFIAPIVFLLCSIGIVYWYIFPQYQQIQTLQSQLSQYADASTQAATAIQKQGTLVAEYGSITPDQQSRLQEFLPDSADDIAVARNITDLASRYKVQIQNIKINDSSQQNGSSGNNSAGNSGTPASSYGTINLAFSVALPYQTFLQFIQAIEGSLHFTNISGIQFSASAAEPYTYSLTLNNYWLN
jgi:hypothetical protein